MLSFSILKERMMFKTTRVFALTAIGCLAGAQGGCTSSPDSGWSSTATASAEDGEQPQPVEDWGIFGDGTGEAVTVEDEVPLEALDPVERATALRATAIDLLLQASQSADPLLRANAIESLHNAPHFAEQVVRRGIVDDNRGVRFVAAMTVGRLRLEHLAHLLEPMTRDESDSVRAAALYGLKRCGYTIDLNPIAGFLFSNDPEVKANAALVLGELGEPSAIPMLRAALGKGLERTSGIRSKLVDLQLAEAMVKLGEESEIEGIRAALFTPAEQGELTALAALMCGRLKDERVMVNLLDLATRSGNRRQPAEVRMAATMAAAQIDPAKAPIEVPLMFLKSDQPQLRLQAALTLGYIGGAEAERAVLQMMGDRSAMVQVASAGAVLQMQSVGRSLARGGSRDATAGSVDTNHSPRYKRELSQAGGNR